MVLLRGEYGLYKHEIVTPENHLPAWLYLHDQNVASYIEPHWHSSVEMSYTICGHIANFFIDGQSYTTSSGTILVVNTMDLHSIRTFNNPNIEQKALTVIFPYHLIKSYKTDISHYSFNINHPQKFSDIQKEAYHELQEKLDKLVTLYHSDHNLGKTIILLEILEILLQAFLEKRVVDAVSDQETKRKERLQEIKAYIEDHFQADISLEDIGNACFLSKEYLARFFKKNMGITVFQYVNYVRAKRAKQLLGEIKEPATRIALRCGFSGLRTMDRALLKIYGVSSRDLKRNRQ